MYVIKGKECSHLKSLSRSFPGTTSGKKPTCQCRRYKKHGFDPWVGKILWRRAWQPAPVFLPGESQGQRSLEGYKVGHNRRGLNTHTHKYLYLRVIVK